MTDRSRARDIGITIGDMQPGSKNAITDVIGVRVGHVSLIEGDDIRTGVTAILPHGGNLLTDKVCAGIHIINAFGKAVGLPQVAELGNIETPILLTNTLNVWTAADALVDYTLQQNPDVRTINPVVGECNDGHLNDIAGRHVLLVEDIVDTGMTLNYLLRYLRELNPASLSVCALLDKRVRRLASVNLNYTGFEVPDEFLVGYGLDYLERYRNMPFIGILRPTEPPQPKSEGEKQSPK